jgi:hypothetical protein
MIALGLLLVAGAGLTVVVGFFANNGADHAIAGGFEVFGYDVNSSTGRLFLYGAIVGVVGMLGLNLLLAGMGRGVRHKVATRRERKTYRRRTETLQEERDRLADELQAQRAAGGPGTDRDPGYDRQAGYDADPAHDVGSADRGERGAAPVAASSDRPGHQTG